MVFVTFDELPNMILSGNPILGAISRLLSSGAKNPGFAGNSNSFFVSKIKVYPRMWMRMKSGVIHIGIANHTEPLPNPAFGMMIERHFMAPVRE